jgi:hypothetical protein
VIKFEGSPEMAKSIALLLSVAAVFVAGAADAAMVYCSAPGIPAGCVVRPAAPALAAAKVAYCTAPGVPVGCVTKPAAAATTARAIYCTSPGLPVGCVARPAATAAAVTPGVGAPEVGVNNVGTGGPGVANQNGGVNRAGRR